MLAQIEIPKEAQSRIDYLFRQAVEAKQKFDMALAELNLKVNALNDCWSLNVMRGLVGQRILTTIIPPILDSSFNAAFNILNDGTVVIPLEEGKYECCEAHSRGKEDILGEGAEGRRERNNPDSGNSESIQ